MINNFLAQWVASARFVEECNVGVATVVGIGRLKGADVIVEGRSVVYGNIISILSIFSASSAPDGDVLAVNEHDGIGQVVNCNLVLLGAQAGKCIGCRA